MTRRSLLLLALIAAAGCGQDFEVIRQKAILTTDPLVDAGSVAVMDRFTMDVELRSMGAAPVVVEEIVIEDDPTSAAAGAFVLLPWQDEDADTARLDPGSEEFPTSRWVQVSFRPEVTGYYRALMTIRSNDTEVDDGVWKVALRGVAQHPCASAAPLFLDFGQRPAGGSFSEFVNVFNCGQVTVTLAAFDVVGENPGSFNVWTADPVYVVPGSFETIEVGWTPPPNLLPDSATISLVTNDSTLTSVIEVIGNDCAQSTDATWDDDSDGWFACGGDCDDSNAEANPSQPERPEGGDNDCDGIVDETANSASTDGDGDTYSENQGDCDDADPAVHPGAEETFNQVDDDCNGKVDDTTLAYDDDADGFSEREGDCDDADILTYPGARESVGDAEDNDCDGEVDEGGLGFDDDGDGFSENDGDCDDADPWAFPEAFEDCDWADNDCDGTADEDDACQYLVVRDVDTGGAPPPSSCATAPGRPWAPLLALAALLALARRRA